MYEEAHEAFNTPCYGVPENKFFNNLQLNIAPASSATSDPTTDLAAALGKAGQSHSDVGDSPRHYTVMTSLSQLQEGAFPGLFHILDLGVCCELPRGVSVIFSGLHRHGGTAPIIPAPLSPCPTDIRITCISYMNFGAGEHTGPSMICSLARRNNIENMIVSPAYLDDGTFFSQQPQSLLTRTTFAKHGKFVMDPQPLELFLRRETYAMHYATLRASSLKPQLQPFHLSGTYDDKRPLPKWTLGPGGDNEKRLQFISKWWSFGLRIAFTVPLLYGKMVNRYCTSDFPMRLSATVASIPGLMGPITEEITNMDTLKALRKAVAVQRMYIKFATYPETYLF